MGKNSRQSSHDEDFENARSSRCSNGGSGILHLTEGLIPKFSGQDKTYPAARWIQDVEDNAEVFGWTAVQQLLMARRSLTGTAELWLRAEHTFKTWEDLKTQIAKEFPDTVDAKTIHEMMSSRHKKHDESCLEYMFVMKELGKRGKMPDYVAIKYIVEGIKDNEVNKIMLYGVTSYHDLKEKLKIYEQFKENISSANREQSKSKHAEKTHRRPVIRCYSCGEANHSSAECPHKGRGLKCFQCNEFGHIASHCKYKMGQSQASTSRGGTSEGVSGEVGNRTRKYFGSASGASGHKAKPNFVGESRITTSTSDSLDDGRTDSNMAAAEECLTAVRSTTGDVNTEQNLIKKPMKEVEVLNRRVSSLIDSGSDVNLLSIDCYENLDAPEFEKSELYLCGLGSNKVKCFGRINLNLVIDGQWYYDVVFYVVPRDAMPYHMIIGQEFLQQCVVLMENNNVRLKPAGNWVYDINVVDSSVVGNEVSPVIREKVNSSVESYVPDKKKEAPIKLKIVLKDDIPVAQRPRRLAPKEQEEVNRQLSEWLDDGIIQVSYSDYASPLVLVKKKDGSIRVCVDYRKLNQKIVKDEYPLPIIESHIDKLSGARVFSTLDLKNGYFHLPVEEESVKFTAFVTPTEQYEFLKAPFGLSICPKVFTRFINIIYRQLIAKGIVLIFIDDLIIPAADEEEAVCRLEEVLKVASEYGLQINWKKSQLVQRKVEYLGHVIEDGQVRPSQEKTDAVVRFPEPANAKQLHSFIGLTSFFRKYIQDYALIAKPLTNLLRKENVFEFDEPCRKAFQELKKRLACHPVLRIFDPNLPTELHTDASRVAVSAILLQRSADDGQLHPVYYLSRKTTPAESKYSSYELEGLAIIEGVKRFRCYLYGRHFRIMTDCKAFQMTLNKKELAMSTRVARWILFLQEYDFDIQHREGSRMRHVDALSRNPYVAIINGVDSSLREKVRQAQEQDEALKAIVELLKSNLQYKDYYLQNDLLYKGEQRHLVIPCAIGNEIIKKAHANGHFSKKKMLLLISKDYYIKNLERKVEEYILTCIPCLLAERKSGKQEGFLYPIPKEELPLHTLHIDHIGPMTETKKLYNHILTVIDAFTKFVWLFPVKSTTAQETLNKLLIYQQCFGNPQRIVTDRGTAFTSALFEDFCKDESIEHIKITTGVPRGNGQVERIHRVLTSALTKLCIEEPTHWYRHVSRVQRALNSTYQRSISTSPFELLIGTKMKQKEDYEIYELIEQENRDSFMLNREENRKKAKEQILHIQEENRRHYNKQRKESTQYQEGDRVAIKRTQFGVGMKLKPKYLGPYEVTSGMGRDRYRVRRLYDSTEGPRNTTTSCDNMKRWPGEE